MSKPADCDVVVEAAGLLGGNAGIERVLVNYVEMIQNIDAWKQVVVLNAEAGSIAETLPEEVEIVTVRTPRTGSMFWARAMLGRIAEKLEPAVWISPATPAPCLNDTRTISVVHDLTYRRYPETMTLASRLYWSLFIRRAVECCDAVIGVSECVSEEIRSEWPAAVDRVHTVKNVGSRDIRDGPVEEPDRSQSARVDGWRRRGGSIALTVGTLEPRKRPEDFVTCGRQLEASGSDLLLVWVGRRGWKSAETIRAFRDCDNILWSGGVSDPELRWYYRSADCFVSFSEYEGFGLPIIEALAWGLPVAVTDICSHREVARRAGRFFPVGDVSAARRTVEETIAEDWDGRAVATDSLQRFGREAATRRLEDVVRRVMAGER